MSILREFQKILIKKEQQANHDLIPCLVIALSYKFQKILIKKEQQAIRNSMKNSANSFQLFQKILIKKEQQEKQLLPWRITDNQ